MKRNYFRNLKNGSKSAMALVAALCLGGASLFAQAATLKLHYSFAPGTVVGTTVNDVSGNGYNGTLLNGAAVLNDGTYDVIDFGTADGYLDMGVGTGVLINSLTGDYSINLLVNFASTANLANYGQWLWGFSNSQDLGGVATGAMFFEPKRGRAAISKTNYGGEAAIQLNEGNFPKGAWTSVSYVQKGAVGYLYINGVLKVQGNVGIKPSELGATIYNYIGRPCYVGDSYIKDAKLTDFRIYSGALTTSEVVNLAGATLPAGFPLDLYPAVEAFTLGELTNVSSDITLPTTAGDGSVSVTWATSNSGVITNAGVVTRPATLDADVILTATFTKNGYSVSKPFVAHVLALTSFTSPLLVKYTFLADKISGSAVKDEADMAFEGTLKNGAVVRQLGTIESGQVNVLDLGNTNGYFDFGAEVGKLIYNLNDFTISAFYRIDQTYTKINEWGNCLWSFTNSQDPVTNLDGDMYFNLKYIEYNISGSYYGSGNTGIGTGTNSTLGVWNHVAYTQKGDVGTIYLNGVAVKTGPVANNPYEVMVKEGKTGTAFNSIGEPAFIADIYLGQTMVYDFQLFNEALSADDVLDVLQVEPTLELLEAAYAAKVGDVVGFPAELQTAYDNLTLGNISGVTSNLTLPTTADGGVAIVWSTSNAAIIDANGAVVQPEKLKTEVLLTATLSKNGYDLKKQFTAFVVPTAPFSSSLLFQYTFEDGSFESSNVKDKGEMQYVASMQNGALIRKMGDAVSGQYNVLDLGGEFGEYEGYLDLGPEIGKLIYGLSDFTMSAYFRVNENYTNLASNGNWLFTFANSDNSNVDRNGYFFLALQNSTFAFSDKYWGSGNQQFSGTLPVQGTWNHIAYTQTGGVGTIYMNGVVMASQAITHKPAIAMVQPGRTGTLYNYIGKSSYQGDAYLKKTYVSDIRMYSEAKSAGDIAALAGSIEALNAAYVANPGVMISTKATNPQTSYVSVVGNKGKISIYNLKGTETVTVKNLVGQSISVTDAASIAVKPGIYLVSINGEVYKVLVK